MPSPYRDVSTMSMVEINRELDGLTGDDPSARERRAELLDSLLSWDMGCGPARRAICERKRPDDHEPQEGQEA